MHTPGPWTLPLGVIGVDKVWSANGEKEICVSYGANWQEVDANMRLIAAAPDMLAALQQAFDTFHNMAREGIDMNTFNRGGIGFEAVQSIAAAIAKATNAA